MLTVANSHKSWKVKFFTIWTGQAFSLLGSQLVQFALVWYLTQETGSATVLATSTLVAMLPQILIGPFAGALVDRWNRRTVMMVGDSLVALATLVLIALFWTGQVQIWHIYLILFVRSASGAFHFPAMQASTSLLVPSDQLSRVAGINQALRGAIGIASPPLGALLLGLLPMQGVLSVDVFTALVAVFSLSLVSIPQPVHQEAPSSGPVASFYADFRAGLRYVYGWPGLMIILGMCIAINFLIGPAFALMPLLVTKHFGGDVYQLSWMQSALGVGLVIGGIVLGIWGGFRSKTLTSMLGLTGLGLGVLAVGLAPANAFWLGLVGLFATGLASPITDGPLFAVVQSKVAPDMQGRVMSLIISLGTAMSPLSMLLAGPLSDRYGISTWYVMGGAACILMALVGRLIPAVIQLEERGHPSYQQTAVSGAATAAAD